MNQMSLQCQKVKETCGHWSQVFYLNYKEGGSWQGCSSQCCWLRTTTEEITGLKDTAWLWACLKWDMGWSQLWLQGENNWLTLFLSYPNQNNFHLANLGSGKFCLQPFLAAPFDMQCHCKATQKPLANTFEVWTQLGSKVSFALFLLSACY